jgi:hypothetical protein
VIDTESGDGAEQWLMRKNPGHGNQSVPLDIENWGIAFSLGILLAPASIRARK